MPHKMHMPTNKLPMPCQIKTWCPKYTRCPNHTPTPLLPTPTPTDTIQFIEFTYYHDIFPEQALTHKHAKYDPPINNIRSKGWNTTPLLTITAGLRGAIHKQSINNLVNLKIPKANIKTLMKDIHQNAIKYLTFFVLNKRRLENKQTTISPP